MVSDCTSDQARNAVGFYMHVPPLEHQSYYDVIGHLKVVFQTGETFNSVVGDFYSHEQNISESEDNFADELQV